MSFNTGLMYGEIINNNTLKEVFHCGNMGGMRRSLKTNTLVIISDHTKGLYEDKWAGDILHYTGMGKKGDQEINKQQNRTLNESNSNGVEVHLFEVFKENNYIYRGRVKLVDIPYQEEQKDEKGKLRKAWIFPVQNIDGCHISIEKDIIEKNFEQKEKKARNLSDKELEEKAKENQAFKTSIRTTTSQIYERNAFVSEYAKRRAKGICQLCNQLAPFRDKNNVPYLETHHIEWLSKGGSDTIKNTVALCPNCHRKMHKVKNQEDIRKLKEVNRDL